jgi:hypothetical protein
MIRELEKIENVRDNRGNPDGSQVFSKGKCNPFSLFPSFRSYYPTRRASNIDKKALRLNLQD